MAQSPGLTAVPNAVVRRRRQMPVSGRVEVVVSDIVSPTDVVARADMPGPVQPLNIAASLGIPREQVGKAVRVAEGQRVRAGQVVAEISLMLGMLRPKVRAPFDGVVESISSVSGQMMLREVPEPIELRAFIGGRVVSVEEGIGVEIEGAVSLIQGIFGIGSEAFGVLELLDAGAGVTGGGASLEGVAGKILLVPGTVGARFVSAAREAGARGVIAASAHGDDLTRLAGKEINLAATGDEDVGLTLILTEGFGELGMSLRVLSILEALRGTDISVCGVTQVRAGVVRPEIVGKALEGFEAARGAGAFGEGSEVRIVRGRWFGLSGRVRGIPAHPAVIGSGSRALVYEVELEGGEKIVVPRANVEP